MAHNEVVKEIWLEGLALVPGIAIGASFSLSDSEEETLLDKDGCRKIESIESELSRFEKAVEASRRELQELCEKLRFDGFSQESDIVDTHLHMLTDPAFLKEVTLNITERRLPAEIIVREILERYRSHFEVLPEPLFRQRFEDVESVFQRVLSFLEPEVQEKIEVPGKSVVFAPIVTASIVAEVIMKDVSAVVTARGGAMSHTAIVAKARRIPYVTNICAHQLSEVQGGSNTIVDGLAGLVIVNPKEETLRRYARLKAAHEAHDDKSRSRFGETKDGCRVMILANVTDVQEARQLSCFGLDGIGLYRSEYQVLERGRFPSEQEQTEVYTEMVKAADGKPVVIRTFDFGSDKAWREVEGVIPEIYLGSRSMELLLKHPDVFCAHLRAIVRASEYGPVSVLFPMVSSITELEASLQMLHEAWTLVSGGWKLPCPRVGVMIELPALAFRARELAGKVDFISVGTNDLTQYSLAVDRSNGASFDPRLAFHPGLLHLIQVIVKEAESANIPLCLCGEMASDPLLTPFLMGLGIRQLSLATRLAPSIKHVLSSFTLEEAQRIADRVLASTSAQETYAFLRARYRDIHFGEQFSTELSDKRVETLSGSSCF